MYRELRTTIRFSKVLNIPKPQLYSTVTTSDFYKIATSYFIKNDPRLAELSLANRELRTTIRFFFGSKNTKTSTLPYRHFE